MKNHNNKHIYAKKEATPEVQPHMPSDRIIYFLNVSVVPSVRIAVAMS